METYRGKIHGGKSVLGVHMARGEFGEITRGEIMRFDCTQYSNCPTLTPRVTSGKKLSQCRERVLKRFTKKRFLFTFENVKSRLFAELHVASSSKL